MKSESISVINLFALLPTLENLGTKLIGSILGLFNKHYQLNIYPFFSILFLFSEIKEGPKTLSLIKNYTKN